MNNRIETFISKLTSSILWKIGAFRVSLDEPFKLVSGNYSPIYVNCRKIISDASAMDMITAFVHWLCVSENITFDIVAGGETAGIPFASYMAAKLAKPMVYIRKRTKGHGLQSLVEGSVKPGKTALLVEDLITNGKSKIDFVYGLKKVDCKVENCMVVFDRQQGGKELLVRNGIRLWMLTDLDTALDVGQEVGSLSSKQRDEVRQYLKDPVDWHSNRDLPYEG